MFNNIFHYKILYILRENKKQKIYNLYMKKVKKKTNYVTLVDDLIIGVLLTALIIPFLILIITMKISL